MRKIKRLKKSWKCQFYVHSLILISIKISLKICFKIQFYFFFRLNMQDTFMTVHLLNKFKNKGSLIWQRNEQLIWYMVSYKLISTIFLFIINIYLNLLNYCNWKVLIFFHLEWSRTPGSKWDFTQRYRFVSWK